MDAETLISRFDAAKRTDAASGVPFVKANTAVGFLRSTILTLEKEEKALDLARKLAAAWPDDAEAVERAEHLATRVADLQKQQAEALPKAEAAVAAWLGQPTA